MIHRRLDEPRRGDRIADFPMSVAPTGARGNRENFVPGACALANNCRRSAAAMCLNTRVQIAFC